MMDSAAHLHGRLPREANLSTGLIALLDDVVALAKLAAVSLDDVATQTTKAGAKAAGVVIDDAAVTPRYLFGFAAKRELPIVRRIAMGSLRNKLVILLPATLSLSYLASWMITPMLIVGGLYLCYEGTEKFIGSFIPQPARPSAHAQLDSDDLEQAKIASAIRTDFILSAEIMAITLASVSGSTILTQALVLAFVGAGITAIIYAAVAMILKADDIGLTLANIDIGGKLGTAVRALGRSLVIGMPSLLNLLGAIGTAAMIWVGGDIIVHGVAGYGASCLGNAIEAAATEFVHAVAFESRTVHAAATAVLLGAAGLFVGTISVAVVRLSLTLFDAGCCRSTR
jgi:uncharacterized protein